MKIRARSCPNIALIKYWGNRNEELRLPHADSLSVTLDAPTVEVLLETHDAFAIRSYEPDGAEKILNEKEKGRLEKHFNLVKKYLASIGTHIDTSVSVEIHSHVPKSVGLASSAAVFSALAEAYAGLAPGISRRDVSILGRLGSGSASRSAYGGFSAMIAGKGDDLGSSYAEQIAPESHWRLWDIVIAPSIEAKKTGSTEGHALASTSPHYAKRLQDIVLRQRQCIEAIMQKDFAALQTVAEEDCLDMHEVMRTSNPPLDYLSADTYRIIEDVKKLRTDKKLAVLYTMDAGPTVHLICEESALADVRAYAHTQTSCHIFETAIGEGSKLL
jgi:diphosphomevalonate decarboxylase